VRARIAEVAARGYVAPEAGTLDIALLFIANEQIFQAVAEAAPELFDEAMRNGVVLVSPLTLLAVLVVVRRAASSFRLSVASRELGCALADLRAAWQAWTDEGELAARRLEQASDGIRAITTTRRFRLDRALARLEAVANGGIVAADGEEKAARPSSLSGPS
jgi:DNA recombination protein RmuC